MTTKEQTTRVDQRDRLRAVIVRAIRERDEAMIAWALRQLPRQPSAYSDVSQRGWYGWHHV